MEKNEKNEKKGIEIRETIDFKVYGCPTKIAKEFKFFADDECGKNYPAALSQLFKYKEFLSLTVNLVNQINSVIEENLLLKKRIEKIEQHLVAQEVKSQPIRTVFGKKVQRP